MTVSYVDIVFFFFSSRRRHTRCSRDWSSDVCSSDLGAPASCPGAGWNYFNAFDESSTGAGGKNAQVDRLPLEATVGWSAELNGNLAEIGRASCRERG